MPCSSTQMDTWAIAETEPVTFQLWHGVSNQTTALAVTIHSKQQSMVPDHCHLGQQGLDFWETD